MSKENSAWIWLLFEGVIIFLFVISLIDKARIVSIIFVFLLIFLYVLYKMEVKYGK